MGQTEQRAVPLCKGFTEALLLQNTLPRHSRDGKDELEASCGVSKETLKKKKRGTLKGHKKKRQPE